MLVNHYINPNKSAISTSRIYSSWKLALYPYCLQKGLIQIKEPILIARFKLRNKSSTENI